MNKKVFILALVMVGANLECSAVRKTRFDRKLEKISNKYKKTTGRYYLYQSRERETGEKWEDGRRMPVFSKVNVFDWDSVDAVYHSTESLSKAMDTFFSKVKGPKNLIDDYFDAYQGDRPLKDTKNSREIDKWASGKADEMRNLLERVYFFSFGYIWAKTLEIAKKLETQLKPDPHKAVKALKRLTKTIDKAAPKNARQFKKLFNQAYRGRSEKYLKSREYGEIAMLGVFWKDLGYLRRDMVNPLLHASSVGLKQFEQDLK